MRQNNDKINGKITAKTAQIILPFFLPWWQNKHCPWVNWNHVVFCILQGPSFLFWPFPARFPKSIGENMYENWGFMEKEGWNRCCFNQIGAFFIYSGCICNHLIFSGEVERKMIATFCFTSHKKCFNALKMFLKISEGQFPGWIPGCGPVRK